MKTYQVDKNYFINKCITNSRLEIMEFLEKEFFTIEKISFYWNISNKNEYEFYGLIYDYLFNISKKCEISKYRFQKFIKEFNL